MSNAKLPAPTMTKAEAIEAMKQGHRVTHRFFGSSEWITLKDGYLIAEDGYTYASSIAAFLKDEYRNHTNAEWNTDWSIFNDLGAGAEATGKSDREIIEKLAEEGGQSKWPEKAAAREAVEQYKERLKERLRKKISDAEDGKRIAGIANLQLLEQNYKGLISGYVAALKLIDELSNKKA